VLPSAPTPSRRLILAAAAERQGLERHRTRLAARREELRAELDDVEAALREVDERDALLQRLATPAPAPATEAAVSALRAAGAGPRAGTAAATPLRGPAIRRAAIGVLLDHPERPQALHYRDWFAELGRAGYAVAGKDPLAVFLTQLSRSPAVRKGTQSGVYELDRTAPQRLRARLDTLHEQLRTLTAAPGGTTDLAGVRARRAELTAEITRTEKALEEVEALLARPASVAAG
jgi:chaperonin cofactor prefoldin